MFRFTLLFEHDLFRKPASIFRDHALIAARDMRRARGRVWLIARVRCAPGTAAGVAAGDAAGVCGTVFLRIDSRRFGRQRLARALDRRRAREVPLPVDSDAGRFENADDRVGDLGADAVAGNEGDGVGQPSPIPPSQTTSAARARYRTAGIASL